MAYVCRLLSLTCLAPDIVAAILNGRQPKGLRLAEMLSKRLTTRAAGGRIRMAQPAQHAGLIPLSALQHYEARVPCRVSPL
jgi:hypothetical protein